MKLLDIDYLVVLKSVKPNEDTKVKEKKQGLQYVWNFPSNIFPEHQTPPPHFKKNLVLASKIRFYKRIVYGLDLYGKTADYH